MIDENGGKPLADFPQDETPKWAEWEVAATLNGSGDSYTEIKMWAMNHTAWPARVAKDIEVRYYFDISEALEKNIPLDQITVEGKAQQYDAGAQGYATVSGPIQYDGNIYYASIKFEDGRAIQPTGQSEHRDEVQFRVSVPDAIDGQSTKGAWDPSNDWSYKGVGKTDLKSDESLNEHFTMYVNGKLVWGEEPDGTKAVPLADIEGAAQGSTPKETTTTPVTTTTVPSSETTTTTTVSETTTSSETTSDSKNSGETGGNPGSFLYGDANCNNTVDVSDAVLVAKYVNSDSTGKISEQGLKNADCDGEKGVSTGDVTRILMYIAKIVTDDQMGKTI